MKKILIIAVLFFSVAIGTASAQAIHLSNYASCSITVKIGAHDGTYPGCACFLSNDIVIAGGGGSVTIASSADLNSPTCTPVCWQTTPVGGSINASTTVWDYALVWATGSGCPAPLGPTTSCTGGVSTSGSLSPCCNASGSWTTFMGDIYIAFQ